MRREGGLYPQEYPGKIELRFPPVTQVDAAYVNTEGELILFHGPKFYRLGHRLELVREGHLSELNINATHINAALVWGHNGRAYVFSGEKYWRLGKDGVADLDYPRDMAVWRDVPKNVSAAFTIGYETFFLAGPVYWTFDSLNMRLQQPPLLIAPHWLSCPHYKQDELTLCSSGKYHVRISRLLFYFLLAFLINVN